MVTTPDKTVILLVEDNPGDARLIRELFRELPDLAFAHAASLNEAFDYLDGGRADLILLDLGLPGSQGMETLKIMLDRFPSFPVIVLTGTSDSDLALESIKAGAQDYLVKGSFEAGLLQRAIQYAIERKHLDTENRKTQETLLTLYKALENSGEVVLMTDTEGVFTYINPAFTALYGYSANEVIGMVTPRILKSGAHAASFYENFWGTLLRGEESKAEFINQTKDGRMITVEGSASPVFNENKKVIGFLGIQRDVTGRRLSEQALKESNNRILSLAENMPGNVAYVNAHTLQYEFVNEQFVRSFGIPREKIIGRHILEIDGEDNYQFALKYIEQVKAGRLVSYENTFNFKNGPRWVQVNYAPVFDAGGEVASIVVLSFDITEQKTAARVLEKNEERFRHISSTISDISYSCLVERSGQPFIDWITGAAERITGYTTGEIMELGCWGKLVVPEDMASFNRHVAGLACGSMGNCELRILHKNGEIRWVASFTECVRIKKHPGQKRLYGGLVDITSRKKAEEELRYSVSLLNASLDSTADGILIVDRDRNIVRWNGKFADLWNLPGEILSKGLDEVALKYVLPQLKDPEAFYSRVHYLYTMPEISSSDVVEFRDGRVFEQYSQPQRVGDTVVGRVWSFREVTERVSSEKRLMESEKKYRSLFDDDLAGNFVTSASGEILLCNKAFAQLFGFPSIEDALHYNVTNLYMGEEKRERYLKLIREHKRLEYVEWELVRLDGKKITVLLNETGEFDENGNLVRMIGYTFDITERKRAEEALKESESRYRSLVEMIPEGIVVHRAGRIVFSNSSAAQISLTKNAEEMIGRSVIEFVHPDYREKALARIKEALETNASVPWSEEVFLRSDGSPITVEVTARPFSYEGAPAMLTIINDISWRREAEAALQKSLELYRLLSENTRDVVWLMDMELNLTYLSPSIEKLRGFTNEELMGMPFDRQLPQQSLKRAMELYADSMQRLKEEPEFKDSPTTELEFYRKDGTTVWLECTFSFIRDENGVYVAILGEGRDITERRQIQGEITKLNAELEQRVLDRTAELQAINKELEAFSYSVSHDLRAPLRAIDGFTSILVEDYGSKMDEEGQQLCGRIQGNTQRMGQLIDDLLAFSRLGRRDITMTRINMKELALSVFNDLASPGLQEKVDLRLDELEPVEGDRMLIHQVWSNLIANALKFSSNRDRIGISISGHRDRNRVVYCVRDNGAGFDMKYKAKLFGVFQRLHSVKEFEGTGVGLAIVQRIINRHGGSVWAEGKIDGGAAFYFSLPAERQ